MTRSDTPHVFVDGLPNLDQPRSSLTLHCSGSFAFIRSGYFLARILLLSGQIAWILERSPFQLSESARKLSRRIHVSGKAFWMGENGRIVAELLSTDDGGVTISARDAETGRQVWEHSIPIPEAADWAERSPAWPGAQTEEINAFFADDPTRLVVCIFRQSRRARMTSNSITVSTVPPHGYQTDAVRLDSATGTPIWRETFRRVGSGRRSFGGPWSNERSVGVIDFETGTNQILSELPNSLGWPVRDGPLVAVPWHSNPGKVGVAWLDERGALVRNGTWRQSRVHATQLHHTNAGLAMQVNEQTLCWLGREDHPRWSFRAKPYIYNVHCAVGSDVFIGTDGNGGRLIGIDPTSGEETLNFKPKLGGLASLAKVPAHDMLVAKIMTSKNYSVPGTLLVLSMKERLHYLIGQCRLLLGTWTHGAVFVTGTTGDRLAIVDLR